MFYPNKEHSFESLVRVDLVLEREQPFLFKILEKFMICKDTRIVLLSVRLDRKENGRGEKND